MIVENATKVIKHDQQCTQPLLSKKGGGADSRGGAYFKIWLIKGALIRRGRLFEGRRQFEDLWYKKIHGLLTQLKFVIIVKTKAYTIFIQISTHPSIT